MMKRQFQILVTLASLFILTLANEVVAAPLKIFVSVLPQKTIVERIGAEHVAVAVMVRPGASPATYEPTPRQIADLAETDLYIRVGVPFEQVWMQRITAASPAMRIIDSREGVPLQPLESHHADDDHQHAAFDPHIWTDPHRVITMADRILAELEFLLPAHKEIFRANHDQLISDLQVLDREIAATLADVRSRTFMVFHPAWGYFAERYGLQQLAVEIEGKEPSARSLLRLVEKARTEQVRTVFVQPQFNRQLARQIAQQVGANVVVLDPLAEDYFSTMQQAATEIAAGVSDG